MPEACRVNAPKSANLGLTEPLQRGFLLQLCRKDAIWQKRQSFREAEKSSGPHTWSATQAALISRAVTKRTLSKGVVCPAGQLLCARQAISPRGAERFELKDNSKHCPVKAIRPPLVYLQSSGIVPSPGNTEIEHQCHLLWFPMLILFFVSSGES